MRTVFSKLREHNLKAKREKCDFAKSYLDYLGHVVLKEGVAVVAAKTRAIAECVAPTEVK